MKIRAIIVDDEIHSSGDLENLLLKYCPTVEVISVAQTVKQAIEVIRKEDPDLVFLDVELPDGDGFNVIEKFPQYHFSLIFVTAFGHYAIKAIKICALDYVLKPVDKDELIAAVSKVQFEKDKLKTEDRRAMLLYNYEQKNIVLQKIALPTTEGLLFIQQEEIVYCAADRNYTNFFLASKEKVLASKPLSYFEELLSNEYFFRTHHSYLVNLVHVKKYIKGKGGSIVMSNGAEVPVAVRIKNDFLERFAK